MSGTFSIDSKKEVQLKLNGSVVTENSLFSQTNKTYKVELRGPLPLAQIASITDVKSDLTFLIDTDVREGKYQVLLMSVDSQKILFTKEIDVNENHDRFDLVLKN